MEAPLWGERILVAMELVFLHAPLSLTVLDLKRRSISGFHNAWPTLVIFSLLVYARLFFVSQVLRRRLTTKSIHHLLQPFQRSSEWEGEEGREEPQERRRRRDLLLVVQQLNHGEHLLWAACRWGESILKAFNRRIVRLGSPCFLIFPTQSQWRES